MNIEIINQNNKEKIDNELFDINVLIDDDKSKIHNILFEIENNEDKSFDENDVSELFIILNGMEMNMNKYLTLFNQYKVEYNDINDFDYEYFNQNCINNTIEDLRNEISSTSFQNMDYL